jgi:hypothetical protein
MSIALDLGVHELRSLRRRHERVIGRKSRAAYAVLPDTAARRRVLEKTRIPFAVCEGSLVLMGDTAVDFAQSFQTPCLPLLADSRVPTHDAPARQVLAALVDALLPDPVEEHEICCLTIPGASRRSDHDTEFLVRIVKLNGYEPLVLGRGHAIVLSELVRDSFTGIGIDFGAGGTEFSLVHRGVEIDRHTLRRGGEWIDQRLAREFDEHAWDVRGHRFLDTDTTRDWKETNGSLLEPAGDRGAFLGEVYTELIVTALEETAAAWSRNPRVPHLPQPLNVVCAGGVSRIGGFGRLFEEIASRGDFPVEIGSVRVVENSTYTIARGCLINAELETETRRRTAAA